MNVTRIGMNLLGYSHTARANGNSTAVRTNNTNDSVEISFGKKTGGKSTSHIHKPKKEDKSKTKPTDDKGKQTDNKKSTDKIGKRN